MLSFHSGFSFDTKIFWPYFLQLMILSYQNSIHSYCKLRFILLVNMEKMPEFNHIP